VSNYYDCKHSNFLLITTHSVYNGYQTSGPRAACGPPVHFMRSCHLSYSNYRMSQGVSNLSEGKLQRVIDHGCMFLEAKQYSGASNHSKQLCWIMSLLWAPSYKLHLVTERTIPSLCTRVSQMKTVKIFLNLIY
jgi:hypothetical protein